MRDLRIENNQLRKALKSMLAFCTWEPERYRFLSETQYKATLHYLHEAKSEASRALGESE